MCGHHVDHEAWGRFRPYRAPLTPQPWASEGAPGPRGQTGDCVLQGFSLHWGPPPALALALGPRWTSASSLFLWPRGGGHLPGLQSVGPRPPSAFVWPEETEGQLDWVPGSLRDDSWAGCGDLALKELPAEICHLLARTGTLPFLVNTKSNIHLVEIYRNIVTWPWPGLKNKGSDTKKFATSNHTSPSHFAFAESFQWL